jgi:hypothetical protein
MQYDIYYLRDTIEVQDGTPEKTLQDKGLAGKFFVLPYTLGRGGEEPHPKHAQAGRLVEIEPKPPEMKEVPVYTVQNRYGREIKGTADELRRQGFRDTQFGWTDMPMGNTD